MKFRAKEKDQQNIMSYPFLADWRERICSLLEPSAHEDFERLASALCTSFLFPYGSLLNGLCGASSFEQRSVRGRISPEKSSAPSGREAEGADLDVTILNNPADPAAPGDRQRTIHELHNVASILAQAGGYEQLQTITRGARMPVVRCVDATSGRKIDVTIDNAKAVMNSLLLRTYAVQSPRCRALAKRVKSWAKQRELILDTTNGLLSSYTYR